MSVEDIMKEEFEVIEILDQDEALFTNGRVDRSLVPDGYYAYDLRGNDDGGDTACEIKNVVTVNHFGTIITREPIGPIDGVTTESGITIGEDDYGFLGDTMTLEEFCES